MTTIQSAATGDWGVGGTWVGGVKPGVNDIGVVNTGHVVTNSAGIECLAIYIYGGSLLDYSGVILTDAPYTGIVIDSTLTSAFTTNASPSVPRNITSSNANPTYPWAFRIQNVAVGTLDTRNIGLDYLELRHGCSWIGNTATSLYFNMGDVTNYGILNPPTPIRRTQKIDEIYCEGRSYSRIYPEGGHAGVLELSGLIPWASMQWQQMIDLADLRGRVGYTGQYCSMPKAYIESLRFGSRDGPYIPFNMTLIEDR